jgi:hypothetical protein
MPFLALLYIPYEAQQQFQGIIYPASLSYVDASDHILMFHISFHARQSCSE